jgi:hypothetical protein
MLDISDELRNIVTTLNESDLLMLDLLLVTPETRSAWDSRIESDWEGTTLSVVTREGLIALSSVSGVAPSIWRISKRWRKERQVPKIDMSPKTISTRLKRVAQLRRLGLSLQKAKLPAGTPRAARKDAEPKASSKSNKAANE